MRSVVIGPSYSIAYHGFGDDEIYEGLLKNISPLDEAESVLDSALKNQVVGRIPWDRFLEFPIKNGCVKNGPVEASRNYTKSPSPVQRRNAPTARPQPRPGNFSRGPQQSSAPRPSRPPQQSKKLVDEEKQVLKKTMEDLFGTRGACIFDQKLKVLGKVPLSELGSTIKSLNGGVYTLALDGTVDLDLVRLAEKVGVTHIVGTSSKVKENPRINIVTDDQL